MNGLGIVQAWKRIATWLARVSGIGFYLYLLFRVYADVLVPRGTFFAINAVPAHWSWTAFLLALIPILLLPAAVRTVADCILWVIYAMVVAPTIVLVQPVIGLMPYGLVCGLILALALAAYLSRLPPLALPIIKLGRIGFLGLLLFVWCASNGFLLAKYGVTLHLVSFANVYDVRGQFAASSTGLVVYVVNWVANAINVVLLVFSLRTKGWRYLVLLAVLSQLDIYGLTGYKSVLAPLALVPLALWVNEVWWRRFLGALGWILAALLATATLVGYAYSALLLGMIDRIFLAPASLTALYYQYFSAHPLPGPVYAVFREIYGVGGQIHTPANIIGRLSVFPLKVMANANLFADGYANFGWSGFIIIGVMLGVCLWLIKSVTRRFGLSLSMALFLVAIVDMLNAGLPTILATHGLALLIVLCYLFPRMRDPVVGRLYPSFHLTNSDKAAPYGYHSRAHDVGA